MIFNEKNQRHIEILREELKRARNSMNEQNAMQRGTDAWATSTIASKDPLFGRVLYRGALDIMRRDPKNEARYNALLANYLRRIEKATIEDLTVREMENFHDLLIKFKNKIDPQKSFDPNDSALTAAAYKDGYVRGGWQGD